MCVSAETETGKIHSLNQSFYDFLIFYINNKIDAFEDNIHKGPGK